jgi:hypothetical protein
VTTTHGGETQGGNAPDGTAQDGAAAEELGRLALEWMLGQEPDVADAPTDATDDDSTDDDSVAEPNPTLHRGTSGVVLALLEGWRHFGDERYAAAALRGARSVADQVEGWDHDSLYFGLAGMASTLRAVQREFDDAGCGVAADRALARVREHFDGERWSPMFELFAGNAGIGLGALAAEDLDLALLAVTPYLKTADRTPGGVNWAVRPTPPRSHHMAHGTLGICYALAAVGRAADRPDLVELALLGTADVLARNEDGPDGFLVPHSDPPHRPDIIERISYGWCNGPAGDATAFRLLADVTGDRMWNEYGDRCWHTVTRSGLPQRLRPGFWDNNARCCGTAGVLATACNRLAAGRDAGGAGENTGTDAAGGADGDAAFAEVLFADLAARATVDGAGARWSNVEHTATPSVLEPNTGWAHGSAGIIRELLRYARIRAGAAPAASWYAVSMPDQLPVAGEGGSVTGP